MRMLIGVGYPATHLTQERPLVQEGEHRWVVVAILAFEQIPINRPAVEPGRRSCLEPAKRKAERRQLLCQPDGGAITQPTP